jgi:hypothetical protein
MAGTFLSGDGTCRLAPLIHADGAKDNNDTCSASTDTSHS